MHESVLAIAEWVYKEFEFALSFQLWFAELGILLCFFRKTFWQKALIVFGLVNYVYLYIYEVFITIYSPDWLCSHELAEGQAGITLGYVFAKLGATLIRFLDPRLYVFGACTPIVVACYFMRKHWLFASHPPIIRRYGIVTMVFSFVFFVTFWVASNLIGYGGSGC